MTTRTSEPEVLQQWGERFRLVIEQRNDSGKPEVVRMQMYTEKRWLPIASNQHADRGSLIYWSRNVIDRHVKKWRNSVESKTRKLQAELDELVQVEMIAQQEVGTP